MPYQKLKSPAHRASALSVYQMNAKSKRLERVMQHTNQALIHMFITWWLRGAARAGLAAALPSSPLLPAANIPLPVISFHLGAEHCFLKRRAEVRSVDRPVQIWGESTRTRGKRPAHLLLKLSASSSVTWPPKTTFLIASDGCARPRLSDGVELQRQPWERGMGKSYLAGSARWRRSGGALILRPREEVGGRGVGAPHRRHPLHVFATTPPSPAQGLSFSL
jgi:hypothetical protein